MISDFNKTKELTVTSASGSPTVDIAFPLFLTDGSEATTGTGNIVLDWTDISSKADIGIYDENDALLNYHFEDFDATAKTAVVWVYNSWTRDGTVQCKVAYGSGPSDQSVTAETLFGNESNMLAGWLLNETSGDALDISGNNNDGTNNGATQGATGQIDGAYEFDSDYVTVDNNINVFGGDFTMKAWVKTTASASFEDILEKNRNGVPNEYEWSLDSGAPKLRADDSVVFTSSTTVNDGDWHQLILTRDGSNNMVQYIDGVSDTSLSYSGTYTLNEKTGIGARYDGVRAMTGFLDDIRLYSKALSSDDVKADYEAGTKTLFSQAAATSPATFIPKLIFI